MSHIYQPVMIKTLLQNNGQADKRTISRALLNYDKSQIDYYENITSNMVGRVLRRNGVVSREKKSFKLTGFEKLNHGEVQELIQLCDQKIDDYIEKRGEKIWEHRRKNRKAVPGSIRYKVLSRAKGRCELCGISKEEKALEVDHIVPKNLGGEDSIDNYQALCYTCNANKRDTDDTDFRNLEADYHVRDVKCIFCADKSKDSILENHLAIAFYDKFPVSQGHTLIIPKRHTQDFYSLTQAEVNSMNRLAHQTKAKLQAEDQSITGFNIGYNAGSSAGQTVNHCHMHLIPRRIGDCEDPTGGVRNVIPGKGNYKLIK